MCPGEGKCRYVRVGGGKRLGRENERGGRRGSKIEGG